MRKIFVSILILMMVTLSCQTDLDVDILKGNPVEVLYCVFTTDSTWAVDLSESASVLVPYPQSKTVTDAEITITDETDGTTERLSLHEFSGYSSFPYNGSSGAIVNNYRGKTTPRSGHFYTITASLPNGSVVRASSIIPVTVPIASIEIDSARYASEYNIEMTLTFDDPGLEKNFYQIKIIRLKRVVSYTYQSIPAGSPIPPKPIVKDSTVTYIDEYFPFGSIDQSDEIISGTVFSDITFNGKRNAMRFTVVNNDHWINAFNPKNINKNPIRVVLMNVTEDYYNYFSAVNLSRKAQNNPLAQPVQIFTNIQGGLGLFTGYGNSEVRIK